MRDRVPQKPGRIALTDEQTGETRYYTMARADNPTEPGTPLNKASLLTDATCSALGLSNTATPNDAFDKLKTLVSNTQTAANNAQSAANAAKTAADNAQSTANAAKTKADSLKFKSGYVSLNAYKRVTVNVGFRPDLAIIYAANNNSGYVPLNDNVSPVNSYIPFILTGAYDGGSDGCNIVDNGISFFQASGKVYYIAIKF